MSRGRSRGRSQPRPAPAVRPAAALVGLLLLVGYAAVAALAYAGLAALWRSTPRWSATILLVAAFTLVAGYASYRIGTARLLADLEAAELPPSRAPELYGRLDDLCATLGIDRPRVLVASLGAPNALSLGGPRSGTIVLDRSLFRLLSPEEFEGIVAHELAHLERNDAFVQTLAYAALRTVVGLLTTALLPVVLLLTGFARASAWIRGRPQSWTATPFGRVRRVVERGVLAIALVLTLAVLAHSRRREYSADDRAAALTDRPIALARALRKIQRSSDPGRGLLSFLYVQRDRDEASSTRLLATHPPTDDRIERLVARDRDRRRDRVGDLEPRSGGR